MNFALNQFAGIRILQGILFIISFFGTCDFVVAIPEDDRDKPVQVFIFAGQSNMVGSDSRAQDIENFPPYAGLDQPQKNVRFAYCIGRESKTISEGWVDLKPVNNIVGPELSFARGVTKRLNAPIAIIKVAAGGTHLGGDWNPDEPSGFKMYPLALKFIKDSLEQLKNEGLEYQLAGFMWHQGENDMFDEGYMENYGDNLEDFLARWRRDLEAPELKFFIGELCTKTIWGMDLRPRMYAISEGQKRVAAADPLAVYVPTSNVGVEIGGGVGLHYHYGTLGQLEHGDNYARAWLKSQGIETVLQRALVKWPYSKSEKIRLFVLAGHRNMEGERAFVQELAAMQGHAKLVENNVQIAFKYSLGGGYRASNGWEPLGPVGYYDSFGPELSFGAKLASEMNSSIAIAKFTHSGSQIIDWTPEGSEAKSRNLYESFIEFVRQSVQELEAKGHDVELAGIFYHVGENDMSFGPYRKKSAARVASLINQSRRDLQMAHLKWYVSQQAPTDDKRVNQIDIVPEFAALANNDVDTVHIKAFELPGREKKLVISTPGIVQLGEVMAEAFLKSRH